MPNSAIVEKEDKGAENCRVIHLSTLQWKNWLTCILYAPLSAQFCLGRYELGRNSWARWVDHLNQSQPNPDPWPEKAANTVKNEISTSPEWYKVEDEGDDHEDDDGEPREEGHREVERVLHFLAQRGHVSDGVLGDAGKFWKCR